MEQREASRKKYRRRSRVSFPSLRHTLVGIDSFAAGTEYTRVFFAE